jgi:simple sugar transport system permease protein
MSTDLATPSRRDVAGRVARTFLDRHASLIPTFAALFIFVVLLIGAQIHFGNFVTPLNMSALLLDNAYLLILAVGMTFVIITGGIDRRSGRSWPSRGFCAPTCSPQATRPRSSSRWWCWAGRRSGC